MAIQASVRQQMLATDLEILAGEIERPSLATVGTDGHPPTREEEIQLNAYLLSMLRMRESQWLQYKSGAIDERTWKSYRAAIPNMFDYEFRRQWWRKRVQEFTRTGVFDPEFVQLVDELIAKSEER